MAFDTATNMQIPLSHIETTGDQPRAMEIDPTGAILWVTTHDTTLGALLSKIDTAGNAELAAEPVGTEIWGIALHPDGTRLYVVDRGADAVHVVDPSTLAISTTIPVGDEPFARGKFIGPIAACGDGELTFPEECDDGNLDDGDCCSSACEIEEGMPCDDGDACTENDLCNAEAVCVSGPAPDCDDGDLCTQDSCDSEIGCINDASPRGGCRQAAKSILQIKDQTDDTKDKLNWLWIKGDAVDIEELGDPTQDTSYALCLYAGTTATFVTDYVVPSGAAWKAAGKGFKYKDKTGASDGIQKTLLKSGASTKSKALVKGKGSGLKDFDLALLEEPVVAQLVSDDTANTGICWSSTFDAQTVIKDEPDHFKAKAQD